MAISINPDRVRVDSPGGPRFRDVNLITCRSCGCSVETFLDGIDHYERDREPDADGEYQLYAVYRCPNRECRADVLDIMYEPTTRAKATRVGY